MALNKKFFPKVSAAAADTFTPSEHFNTVLYTGNGGTQRIGGYINRGAIFNGSSSYISTSNPLGTGNVANSVSAWINLNASSHTGGIYTIWDGGTSSGTYLFFKVEGGKISVGNYGSAVTSANTLPVGQWVHVVVTRDTSNNVVLYVNGSSDTTGTLSLNLGNHSPKIGALDTTTQNLNGKLDQVRIFNKELSSSEVTTLNGETHASTTISTTDIFNDNSGVALYQLDGNANDTGGVSGKFGSAAIFNGSSSKIVNSNFASLSQVGISMWVNIADVTSNYTLIARYGTNREFAIYNYQTTNGFIANLYYNGNNGNAITITAGDYLTNNTWHHIAYTADGSTQPKLYIDGVQRGTAQSSNNTYYTSTESLDIGGNTSLNRYLNGKIDDVRIYSDALSSTEVGYLYNNTTASIPTDNLVAYYKLDGDARDEQQLYDGTASNVTYAYDGTASNVTYQEATKFTPDLVWTKRRNTTGNHLLYDSTRGAGFYVSSNSTNTQNGAAQLDTLASFDSNGFTVGTSAGSNASGGTYAAWCFNAGSGSSGSNTDGSITSTVKANTDAGFSIVEFTSPSSGVATIGTGLNTQPKLIISKVTNTTADWPVFVDGFDTTDYILLNTTAAKVNHSSDLWNLSNWSNTTFGCHRDMYGTSNTVIAYCFHDVTGYQKIGSYTGTGAAGNMVETGFEPAFLLIKQTNISGSNWNIIDNKRDTENPRDAVLWADTSDTESTASQSGVYDVNFLSNGFSLENTYQPFNASGGTYIYLAIAADPDTTTPTVENSFDVVTYTGTGSTQSIATDMKPDLVWIKSRTGTRSHALYDSIRGANKRLVSNGTQAEISNSAFASFDSGGFTVTGTDSSSNNNGEDYVAWCFKAGDHDDNLPEINTEGTIDSTVSVNDAAGFSIVTFPGASGAQTVGHGLSTAPELIIMKSYDVGGSWGVYVKDLGADKYLTLNSTASAATSTTAWNNTHPTSTVLSWQGGIVAAGSGYNNIVYCWYSVTGYSKIGSYTGTGSSGKTVTTGFRPRWVMIKRTDSTNDWVIIDSTRDTSDPYSKILWADLSDAEADGGSTTALSFSDTGFSMSTSAVGGSINASGGTYIYLAFK